MDISLKDFYKRQLVVILVGMRNADRTINLNSDHDLAELNRIFNLSDEDFEKLWHDTYLTRNN